MPKFRTKNTSYFWTGISNIVIFETSTLEFNKNEFLIYPEFCVGFAFFKAPGYVFSECPSPLPGPLYNECRTQAYNAKHSTPQSFVSL